MRQLALPLGAPPLPRFDNFVAGDNQECVARLRQLAGGDRQQRYFYLWGTNGSGRSHLLAALQASGVATRWFAKARDGESPAGASAAVESALSGYLDELDTIASDDRLYLADDIDQLSERGQLDLFHLFNHLLARPRAALVMVGSAPPQQTAVREDLRTRLGAALVFQVHALSDPDKKLALLAAAKERGVAISADLADFLLAHYPRDLGTLMTLLDALDRYAMEQKRAITLPLLREFSSLAIVPAPPER